MKTFRVGFEPEAEADLLAIYEYIKADGGLMRAGAYVARITEACMALSTFPERGIRRDDLAPGLRILGFERRAAIVFRIQGDTVRIIGVSYGGRNYEARLRPSDPDQPD